jgi:hypothetical protein
MPFEVQTGKGFLGPIMATEMRTVPSAMVHNGDEFICVLSEDDLPMSIRWSAVEKYERIKFEKSNEHNK